MYEKLVYRVQLAVQVFPSFMYKIFRSLLSILMYDVAVDPTITRVLSPCLLNSTPLRSGIPFEKAKLYFVPLAIFVTNTLPSLELMLLSLSL